MEADGSCAYTLTNGDNILRVSSEGFNIVANPYVISLCEKSIWVSRVVPYSQPKAARWSRKPTLVCLADMSALLVANPKTMDYLMLLWN